MKERPILFSGPMVRAILDGRKTHTRRIVKPMHLKWFDHAIQLGECSNFIDNKKQDGDDKYLSGLCPHGSVGDHLWVRETMYSDGDGWWFPEKGEFSFENTCATEKEILDWCAHQQRMERLTVPSIHMPRWASRITLEIADVRVERLQDITAEDALAEGIDHNPMNYPPSEFACLWDSINADRAPWDSNPLVWVLEFRRIK